MRDPDFVRDPRHDVGGEHAGRLHAPPIVDEDGYRARYEHDLRDEEAGKTPWPLERFRRWFSDRF